LFYLAQKINIAFRILCISSKTATHILWSTPDSYMATADNFAVEQEAANKAIEWMNAYAKKNNHKFEAKLKGYTLQTLQFGTFEVISWKGEWSAARNIINRASSKLGIKVVESGYHENKSLLASMLGSSEFAKVYSGGRLVGNIELGSKSGRWIARSEKMV